MTKIHTPNASVDAPAGMTRDVCALCAGAAVFKTTEHAGVGIFAASDIGVGEVVISVPRECVLTATKARVCACVVNLRTSNSN